MDSHAILAWNSMQGEHGEGEAPWGVPRSRRRPGYAEGPGNNLQAAPCARRAGSLRDRTAGRRGLDGRGEDRHRRGRARPEEGARPWPRHGDHPRPLLLPGPRPASRPALHSRQHRPRRHPGRHPLHHLQEGLDGHGPAPGTPDRAVQVPRGLPGLRHAPNQSGPSWTTSSRWNSAAATTPPTCGRSTRRHRTRRTRSRTP